MIACADERRQMMAQAISANRLRAGQSVLTAVRPPENVPPSVECVLLPETIEDVRIAARAEHGVIVATHSLAASSGADRPARGLAIVLLGHSDPKHLAPMLNHKYTGSANDNEADQDIEGISKPCRQRHERQ